MKSENSDVLSNDERNSIAEIALMPTGLNGVIRSIRQHIHNATGWSSRDDADNFFDRGMDSLHGLQLMRELRRSFHRPDIALLTIYQCSFNRIYKYNRIVPATSVAEP